MKIALSTAAKIGLGCAGVAVSSVVAWNLSKKDNFEFHFSYKGGNIEAEIKARNDALEKAQSMKKENPNSNIYLLRCLKKGSEEGKIKASNDKDCGYGWEKSENIFSGSVTGNEEKFTSKFNLESNEESSSKANSFAQSLLKLKEYKDLYLVKCTPNDTSGKQKSYVEIKSKNDKKCPDGWTGSSSTKVT